MRVLGVLCEKWEGEGLTVIRHVEGRESGISVTEHGIDGVVSVDSPPTAARLPHPVQDSANLEGVVSILHCHYPLLLECCLNGSLTTERGWITIPALGSATWFEAENSWKRSCHFQWRWRDWERDNSRSGSCRLRIYEGKLLLLLLFFFGGF